MHGSLGGWGALLAGVAMLLGRPPEPAAPPAAAPPHEAVACTSCHLDTGGGRETAGVTPQACLSCHDTGHVALWPGGAHQRRDVGCAACHSVHAPRRAAGILRAGDEAALCQGCHAAVRARFLRASRHPVPDGPLSCGSCHDPHGSAGDGMLRAPTVNETCQSCHAETRGPFLWEHAPAAEDCGTCHDPHGSSHRPLLQSRVPWLCQRCHVSVQHPSALFDRTNTGGAGPFGRAPEHACARCHRAVHGSNHPSGAYLER